VLAALWTERLYPFLEEFSRCAGSDHSRLFERLLKSVWDYVATGSSGGADFSKLKEQCYGIELANEDGDSKYPGCDPWRGALDAVGALYQTIELCEGGDSDKAAKVAEITMERIRREVENSLLLPGVLTEQQQQDAEAVVFRSAEMQREIDIQERHLACLKGARAISKQLIAELRKSADTH
jgi:uncharacterized protein YjaG (DUF416 family)